MKLYLTCESGETSPNHYTNLVKNDRISWWRLPWKFIWFKVKSLLHFRRIPNNAVVLGEIHLVLEYIEETESEDVDHMDCQRNEEHEEITIVSPPYTVVHPGAVMIECLKSKQNTDSYLWIYYKDISLPGWERKLDVSMVAICQLQAKGQNTGSHQAQCVCHIGGIIRIPVTISWVKNDTTPFTCTICQSTFCGFLN